MLDTELAQMLRMRMNGRILAIIKTPLRLREAVLINVWMVKSMRTNRLGALRWMRFRESEWILLRFLLLSQRVLVCNEFIEQVG